MARSIKYAPGFRALLLSGALALSACGGGGGGGSPAPAPTPTPAPAPAPTPTPTPTPTPSAAPTTVISAPLRAVFDRSEADRDPLFPLDAQLQGKAQYASRFGDYYSDAWYAAVRALAERDLAAINAIDRSQLNAVEKVAYDAFKYRQERTLASYQPAFLAFERGLPMNHMTGIQSFYPTYASGLGPIPFDTLQDYRDNIPRTREFAAALDAVITAFRRGAAAGIVESRVTTQIVIAQLDALLDDSVETSPFYRPVTVFPAAIGAADRTQLTADYRALVTDDVLPAVQRLRNYLVTEYLPQTRLTPGLAALPGGQAYYDFLIEQSTTLNFTADQVHQLGLQEVQRINQRMTAIKDAQGFSGTLDEFGQSLHARPELGVASRAAYLQLYQNIAGQTAPLIGGLFRFQPVTPLVIQPYDAAREQFMFAASYTPGSVEASRAGVFNFNAGQIGGHQLSATSIYLHEGAPGHHFQIMRAKEDTGLPAFMKNANIIAYTEGWALYAETLGYEMGLYGDSLIEWGHLTQEMLRALRLVIDTGIHDKGWSRQQAIDFAVNNSTFGPGIAGEVDRYIAWPSQALGYKIGALKIQELRSTAQAQLGTRFDIRDFHEQLLATGVLPLPILEAKITAWAATQ